MTIPLIVHHDSCHDGITALWAAKQRLPDAEAYAGKHNEPPDLDRFRGKHVVFVDFCYRAESMIDVRSVARSVLVLDHHKTARDDMLAAKAKGVNVIDVAEWRNRRDGPLSWQWHLENVQQDVVENVHTSIYVLFDMERSGAGIAWDVLVGGTRPVLIDYVEDRDLWRFALPHSREVHAALGSFPLDLETRTELMKIDIEDLAARGTGILRYHDKIVASAAKHAGRENIGGHVVPSIACPVIEISSDLGHTLAKGHPFAAVFVDKPDGSRRYQLRSTDEGLDVGEIAKSLGGGGHRNAAGFTTRIKSL